MKMISAILIPLALSTGPAFAQPADQSTLSGSVTLKVVPPMPRDAQGPPQAAETVTVRIERPTRSADEDEDAEQHNLETCGKIWNAKLKAYWDNLERTKLYRVYWEKWKDSPAQRPPAPSEPVLTRVSYRQHMAQCLEDDRDVPRRAAGACE
jgi:hypothetical protein